MCARYAPDRHVQLVTEHGNTHSLLQTAEIWISQGTVLQGRELSLRVKLPWFSHVKICHLAARAGTIAEMEISVFPYKKWSLPVIQNGPDTGDIKFMHCSIVGNSVSASEHLLLWGKIGSTERGGRRSWLPWSMCLLPGALFPSMFWRYAVENSCFLRQPPL